MNYNDFNDNVNNMRQKDLVLASNEFCFLQNKTNGQIKTYTGPIMLTISQQESLVNFDPISKQFKETTNFDHAKQLFVSAPENWYVILKNPAVGNIYPEIGKAVASPELLTGRKINLRGPINFSLFPGQMTKVIKGHSLRSNQYLLARVYEADAASQSHGEMLDSEGNKIENKQKYVNGQILVIKGTEVSFYIPPTGIEVIPIHNDESRNGYVRDAITLERLEYCILKDEDGNKRYVHGPAVVFPEPTETFVNSPKGGCIFRAIELSKITGIYVKVIAEYEENGVKHPVGEEMFITGNDQMIYYPRPEHAIINYDNKITHHAIAIPEGEGRYIMNRMTGEITTTKGPAMYLPDPRTEVVVQRKLTEAQCRLWYPNNNEVLQHNIALNEKAVERSLKKGVNLDAFSFMASTSLDTTLANLEANANISRGTSYTKPRTITLDNRFDGVVSIDVWTGYAVNVVSKNGNRETVCGPKTILLDYDQTLEVLQMSTGKPKSTDRLIKTVFLRHENNKISDIVRLETKDFVHCDVKVSYCVDFDKDYQDKWFSVENYVKYLCDRVRSDLKRAAKQYTVEEFYQNYSDIVRAVAIDTGCETDVSNGKKGRFFHENGMYVHDCEVLSISVDEEIEEMLTAHQYEMIQQSLKLSDADKRVTVATALAEAEEKEQELLTQKLLNKMELQRQEAINKLSIQDEVERKREAREIAAKEAERDMQIIIDAIHQSELERKQREADIRLNEERELARIEEEKQKAYAETIANIMKSIQPELVAAMESKANADMTVAIGKAIAPYALAKDESAADVINTVLRGTSLENVIKGVNVNV